MLLASVERDIDERTHSFELISGIRTALFSRVVIAATQMTSVYTLLQTSTR